MNYEITRKHAFEHKISVHCVSSSIVGIDAQCEYTFTSLMPINSHNANTSSLYFEGNSKEALKKPTNGSDTPKERKRKNNGEEISQSKEKKKRDNALAEKIKLLKESFGRTSTVLKKDLQKTEEMTRNALNNLVYPDHPESYSKAIDMNTISINDEVNFDETHVDVNFPDNDDDILDDAKIDSILSEIETEITKTNSTPKGHSEKRGEFNQKYPSEKHSAMNKINSTAKQNINMRNRANKPGSNKCNYKFLDLLEKNMDLSDDDVIPVKETGFSDAIKQQVEKYIQSSCLAPPAIDLTMTNLYQEPESTRSIVPTVNSTNKTIYDVESNNAVYSYTDFKQPLSMNMSTSTLTVPAETKSPITKIINDELFKNNIENSNTNLNNDNITLSNNIHCTNKPENINKHNDSDCIHEELPEVDVIGHNTKQVSAHVSDISRDTEKYENKAICSITSAERNDNNLSFSNTQPHHSKHCDNNITDVALEIFTEKESPNTDITISNDTEKTCITSTNNETILKLHNDNKNTNSQHGQLHPSHLSPTSVSDELSMLDKINEICLWNQHVKDIDFKQIKSSVAHNGNEKQIPNVSAIGTVFNSSNNDEAKDLGQSLCKQNYTTSNQNEQNNSQFTKNKHKEYENKYTFSAEKVDVQTKYTKDHKIRVIRTLKVDLDVREIVSDYKTESKLSNKTQEVISNKCVKEKPSVTYIDQETFNSLTHNHTEMDNSKESPENNLIADINKNREKTNMIESIQNDDKNESKDSTNELSVKADETSMVQDNAVVMDNTKLDASKPTSNIEEPNKENGISTILQKFGNIIRNKKNEATSSPRIFASTMSNNVQQSTFKPKRPFRITKIQTIDAPIPIIYENKPKPATPSQVGNVVSINANRIEKALEVENQQTLEKIPKTPEKLPYLDLTPCQSPETLLESSLEITEDDFKIDQSMLNPKTLLQNMGTEDITLDIIPPPPEFCNNDIDYSPVNDDFEQLSFSENLNQTLEERLNRSENEQVFPNTANFTPSDEIETWTLDCDDELESSYSAPTQSFTAIRRKLFENYNKHSLNINGTTTKRLSQFKYNRKTTFK
ncbi:putative uncharacterized protein DDB_G0282133 [Ostrinia furnacalis]|uniref:putative uncharacterized protein DDB_G0282133 n=1 Tax=Ostrinia furnacalis TaxID=93504 RepID=UPI00103FB5F7|nr:putative uncharacterized protein DDB_G0282133 [Ostrinia furnacalis]